MTLRLYLLSVAFTWLTAVAGYLLITHGLLVLALLVLVIYCCVLLATAFEIETHSAPPYNPYEDCQ